MADAELHGAMTKLPKLFAFFVDNFVDEGAKYRPNPIRVRLWSGCLNFMQCHGCYFEMLEKCF
jgi:hypothetical protein